MIFIAFTSFRKFSSDKNIGNKLIIESMQVPLRHKFENYISGILKLDGSVFFFMTFTTPHNWEIILALW